MEANRIEETGGKAWLSEVADTLLRSDPAMLPDPGRTLIQVGHHCLMPT